MLYVKNLRKYSVETIADGMHLIQTQAMVDKFHQTKAPLSLIEKLVSARLNEAWLKGLVEAAPIYEEILVNVIAEKNETVQRDLAKMA